MEEEEVLRLLSSHRNEAYEYLYSQYYTPLALFAKHYVPDQETAQDLVQEVFIALLEVTSKFENLLHLKSYLYSSLRNKCLNYLRHKKIEQEFARDARYQTEEFFEQKLIEEDVYSILIAAVDALSPQSREVMVLSIDGLSNAEIADRLNLSIETVKSYKKNSKKKITEFLSNKEFPAFGLVITFLEIYVK